MMNWLAQVWHIAKKDVLQFWWLLGVQVLATVMALAAAVSPAFHRGESFWILRAPGDTEPGIVVGLVLLFLSILIAVLVVQTDSPSRSDAFWASRPLHPLSVLTAKGATLGVFLLGLPLAAQAVVLWQHAVPPTEMVPMLGASLIFQGGVVAAAAALAALTADLRGFLLVGIGAGLAGLAVTNVISRVVDGAFRTNSMSETLTPVLVLGLAVLAYQYSSRNLRRSIIGATVGSVAGLAILGWTGVPAEGPSEMAVTASPAVVRTDLRWGAFELEPVTRNNPGQQQSWTLWTTVRLEDADPRFEYTLLSATARLHLADGTVTERPITRRIQLGSPSEQLGGLEWLFEVSDVGEAGARIEVARLSSVQVQSLAARGGRLELDGRVDVREVEDRGSLPLRVEAENTRGYTRFRVLSVRPPGGSGPFLKLFYESTALPGGIPDNVRYQRYALVNRELGQGLFVPPESGQYVGYHAMVIEGGPMTSAAVFELDVPWVFTERGRARAVDETWTAGAELMIINAVSVGGYPIVAEHEDVRIELDESELR